VLVSEQDPTKEGNKVCPGLGGGHNWQATTYSPETGLYYFPTTDGCDIYFKTTQAYIEGQWYQASTANSVPAEPNTGSILAVDPATGETKWRFGPDVRAAGQSPGEAARKAVNSAPCRRFHLNSFASRDGRPCSAVTNSAHRPKTSPDNCSSRSALA